MVWQPNMQNRPPDKITPISLQEQITQRLHTDLEWSVQMIEAIQLGGGGGGGGCYWPARFTGANLQLLIPATAV